MSYGWWGKNSKNFVLSEGFIRNCFLFIKQRIFSFCLQNCVCRVLKPTKQVGRHVFR